MKSDGFIGLIILNYNNYQDTINCIDSIEKYNTAPIKYFVVDNASPDVKVIPNLDHYFDIKFKSDYIKIKYGDELTLHDYKLLFILNSSNEGYAKGNNVGIEYAYHDKDIRKLIIMNNDILFTSDIIATLANWYDRLENVAFITPLLFKSDGKTFEYGCARLNPTNNELLANCLVFDKGWFGIKRRNAERSYILLNNPNCVNEEYVKIELPVGAFMMIDKQLMHDIGNFDPNTFLYYEENILFKKTSRLGLQNYLIPGVSCIHIGAASTSSNTPKFSGIGIHSIQYYVYNYSGMNFIQLFLFTISLKMNYFLRYIQKHLFK